MARVATFVTIGVMGFVLQLSALALLTMPVGWPYGPATAIAVELAVLHNFWWHERWTWHDRARASGLWRRVVRFHVSNGVMSIAGNVAITVLVVELAGAPPVVANAGAVALTAVANYLAADRWVFASREVQGSG